MLYLMVIWFSAEVEGDLEIFAVMFLFYKVLMVFGWRGERRFKEKFNLCQKEVFAGDGCGQRPRWQG